MATNENATNSQWTAHDAPAQIETSDHDATAAKSFVKTLENKGENELRVIYADAQHEESNAKQDLYMLRQRVANLGTDIQTNEEVLLKSAKQRVADGLARLKAIESRFGGAAPSTPTTQEVDVTNPTAPAESAPVAATAQDISTPQEPPADSE